ELRRLFAKLQKVNRPGREHTGGGQRPRQTGATLCADRRGLDGRRSREIAQCILRDTERRDQRHTVLQEAAERSRQSRCKRLTPEAAGDWQSQYKTVDLQSVDGVGQQMSGN